MRGRLSYANVAATLALVFSMSGGALAATHYLINSTKQINPKVLKALKGRQGPAGPRGRAGATGPAGSAGAAGATGAAGSFSGALSRGQTVRGTYDVGATAVGGNSLVASSISFLALMAAVPTAVVVPEGGKPPAECPGTVELPQAEPGFLCVYENERENTEGIKVNPPRRFGATIYLFSKNPGEFFSSGTWAATAG